MRQKKGCYRNRKEMTGEERTAEHDFFPTYHALTQLLLDNIIFSTQDIFLEPCAGAGDITKILRKNKYNHILQCDLQPRALDIEKLDFLKDYKKYQGQVNNIITNPPFKLSIEFIAACSKVAQDNIIMLWPLDYLHGVERYAEIYEKGINGFFLDIVYLFVRRPLFGANYHPAGPMPTGATSFAWFHFKRVSSSNMPKIEWLHNNDQMGVPWHNDQQRFF